MATNRLKDALIEEQITRLLTTLDRCIYDLDDCNSDYIDQSIRMAINMAIENLMWAKSRYEIDPAYHNEQIWENFVLLDREEAISL